MKQAILRASFFAGLYEEVSKDSNEAEDEYVKLHIRQKRTEDGKWKIKGWWQAWSDDERSASGSSSEEDGGDSDSPASPDNLRISTAATDA